MIECGRLSVDEIFSGIINSPEYKKRNDDENKILEIDCGGYYVCVKKAEKDLGSTIAKCNTWEPHIINAMSEILKQGNTFIDIGANVGVMTFHGAKLVGETGKVIAVEPNPDNLQLLYRGILKNNTRNVYVMPFAASDKIEIFSITGVSNAHLTTPEDGKDYVQSIILDHHLNDLERIDLVKIDTEGHEPYALNGFRHLLKLYKPTIIMEFAPICLKDNSGLNPKEYLNTIFEMFENVQTIEPSGKFVQFSNPFKLWEYWEERNKEFVRTNWLPDGMLHFDLLAKAK